MGLKIVHLMLFDCGKSGSLYMLYISAIRVGKYQDNLIQIMQIKQKYRTVILFFYLSVRRLPYGVPPSEINLSVRTYV
jgi:hypothetical protein